MTTYIFSFTKATHTFLAAGNQFIFCREDVVAAFVSCGMFQTSWQMGNASIWDPGGFAFLWGGLPGKGTQFFLGGCDLHRNYGMVVILFSFLCNYDNLTLKLHHEKRSYPDKRWLFIDRFKVGSVPGKSVALVTSKKSIKIHHEYDVRPLIK